MGRSQRLIFVIFGMALASFVTASAAGVAWVTYRALPTAPAAWRTYRDPAGFSLEVPPRWSVHPDGASGRIEIPGPTGERLVAWPLFSSSRLDRKTGGSLAARMARRIWPQTTWGPAEPVGDRAIRVRGQHGEITAAGVVTWTLTERGSAAFAYLMSAPRGRALAAEASFARILAGLRVFGPKPVATHAAAPPARYVRFEDPSERAFSVELPAGWRAQGGALRPGNLIVQARVEAGSPDGSMALHLGDDFPIYAEPSRVLAMAGIGSGGTYIDPMGYPTPVQAYMPGAAFALRVVLPQRVGTFRLVRQADRSDLARRIATAGINRFDAGEAEYRFTRAGREHRGFVLCITERVQTPAVTLWHAWRLYVVEAEASRFEEASSALGHAARSFRIDPDWAQRQARLTAAQVGIITEMGESVARTLSEAYEARQASLDEIHRRGGKARLEIEELEDPLTKRRMTVDSGSSYYWVDDQGHVFGTQTDTRPSVDFRELTRLP
jgi:hypothetical protein